MYCLKIIHDNSEEELCLFWLTESQVKVDFAPLHGYANLCAVHV